MKSYIAVAIRWIVPEEISNEEASTFKDFKQFMAANFKSFNLRLHLPLPLPVDIPLHFTQMKIFVADFEDEFGNNILLFVFLERHSNQDNRH